ncbi:MAG: DNA recombination/repair protein RecA, partial [Phycisphaerae bacterium]|nr:DNA recombination/repair protein RecA [Phycisphaerae bacterium]
FGNPETTPGGNALKFYSSVRLDIRRATTIKDGETPIGTRVRVRVVKNKVAPPFRKAEFDIMFDSGISTTGDMLDLAVEEEIVKKQGAWFSYGEVRLGQGRENSKKFLSDNPDLIAEIKQKVEEKLIPGCAPAENAEEPQEAETQETPKAEDVSVEA